MVVKEPDLTKIPTRDEIEPFFIEWIWPNDLRREIAVQSRFIEALIFHSQLQAKKLKEQDAQMDRMIVSLKTDV